MLPDRVSNPGPLTYESGALPIALRGPAIIRVTKDSLENPATGVILYEKELKRPSNISDADTPTGSQEAITDSKQKTYK